jgi:alkylation response protein AidB-like acyl-CoA dehydrogenase
LRGTPLGPRLRGDDGVWVTLERVYRAIRAPRIDEGATDVRRLIVVGPVQNDKAGGNP